MEYPAILQHPMQEYSDIVYLATSKDDDGLTNVICLFNDENYGYKYGQKTRLNKEHKHVNITREYLEGKCVKIESPEHSEFVQKLAFNAGFKWYESGTGVNHTDAEYISFWADGDITYGDTQDHIFEQITIPLPPKAEPKPKEWPQVGDNATWGSQAENAEVIAIHKGRAWVFSDSGYHIEVEAGRLKKPKTEAEILRDEVYYVILNRGDSNIAASAATNDLFEQFNITKKPQ